jgi:signal transduction histidine kinase/ActR/RegA family two-component response regulator
MNRTKGRANDRAAKAPPPQWGLFRKYVAMFAGVVSLALAINAASDIWFSYQTQKALLFRIQRGQAQSAAERIGQFLNQVTAGLAWETQLSWSDNTLDEWQFDAVRLMRQVPAITQLVQLDGSGREQFRISREEPDVVKSGADYSHDPAFIQARAHRRYFGPVYFVDESQPYMTIAMAGLRPEFGVIIAQVNLTFIWDVVSQIKVGKSGRAYVVDDKARLIAHPDISNVLRKTDMSGLAQVQMARAAESSGLPDQPLDGVDLNGRGVLSAYAKVTPTGWLVFAELPNNEAYAPLYESALRSGALVVVALALAVFAGFLLARRMVVPIRALQAGAERIGGGDLAQRISISTGDELEALGGQFNRMAEHLQESYATLEQKVEERTRQLDLANKAKSRFLATATHDLRQPLHALGLFVAQLSGRNNAAQRREIVCGIEAALSGMNELFNALLDISKLDAGVVKPKWDTLPTANVLRRVENTFAGWAREKDLALHIVPSSAWVRSDALMLAQIVSNLVQNAIRYTRSGRVLVGCRRRGDRLRIEVWDTGRGIAPDQQQNIFSEFYRVEGSERDSSGLGLGLAIVDRLCRLLDHPIEVKSVPGKGSCFAIAVPMVAPADAITVSQPEAQPRAIAADNKLIVVIDDDPLVLDGMGSLIKSWGCGVITGSDESAALDRLSRSSARPDAIISDYRLRNGKTGIEAIARLREATAAPIPAFLMSGDTDLDVVREAKASGLALLHKPVEPATLRAMLVEALKRSAMTSDMAGVV